MAEKIEKTFTIRADRETMRKVEALLALMHFNCGHSHSLGMHFDGDGPTHLEVVDAEFTEGPNEHYRLASRKVGEYAGRPISMVMATGDDDIPFVVYNGTLERPRRIGVFGELVKDNG